MTRPESAGVGTAEMIAREYLGVTPAALFLRDAIASAITAAESRTMERCAKIVEGNMIHGRYREWPSWGTGNRGVEDDTVRLTQALARTIRSSINPPAK